MPAALLCAQLTDQELNSAAAFLADLRSEPPLGGNLSLTRIPPTVAPTPCRVVRGGTNASTDWLTRNHPVGVNDLTHKR
jgi:hypothetical protein